MSDTPADLHTVKERLQRAAYEHGGPKAVKDSEKHIDKALRELDRKREREGR